VPVRMGVPVTPAEADWIIKRNAPDLPSRSLRADATSASLRRADPTSGSLRKSGACLPRQPRLDKPEIISPVWGDSEVG